MAPAGWEAREVVYRICDTIAAAPSAVVLGPPSVTRCGRIPAWYTPLPSVPSPPMATFLTVKEASRLTGKSPSSIRRVLYPILHDDAHPDRAHIAPGVEEALQFRLRGDNFAWRVSEELLRRE